MGGLQNGHLTTMPDADPPAQLHGWGAVLRGRKNADGRGGPAMPLPAATPTVACATPPENYSYHCNAAADKNAYPWPKLAVLGVLAGVYIGLGYSLCCLVAGQLDPEIRKTNPGWFNFLFGIYGFPMGLTLCVVAGADLFTSNCMYATIAAWEGRYGLAGVVRCLVSSYLCNLVGSLLLVGLMVGGEVFQGREAFVIELALKKTSHSFGVTLCKGILCNWLVCLAVWQGNMAKDLTGKFIGIFLPNSAFVSMGFEHCIANMYLIPLSMCLGSGISVGTFVGRNLVPSTIGNLIGGGLFVGTAYAASFGTPAHWISDMWEAALSGRHSHVPHSSSSLPAGTFSLPAVSSSKQPAKEAGADGRPANGSSSFYV